MTTTDLDDREQGAGRRESQGADGLSLLVEAVVVLDNLDTVTSGECLSSIDYAVAHLPAPA